MLPQPKLEARRYVAIVGVNRLMVSCVTKHQAPKNDRQSHGDIIPPIPFFMRPTAIALYVRHKLGTQAMLKAARSPTVVLKTQGVDKPTGRTVILTK